MALTRKSLKAMGLTDEQIDSVIDMHSETVEALKAQITAAEEKATDYDAVKSQLDALKGSESYKEKFEAEHKAFEDYKKGIADREAQAAKEQAVRAYFEGKKITGGNLNIAMRGATKEIAGITLNDSGKIADTTALDALVTGEYSALVVSTDRHGADTPTPPANDSRDFDSMSDADYYKATYEATKKK